LKERESAPQDDLLTRLLEHRNAGRMTEDELIATAMLILMAGHGSTIDVLGSGMHALLKNPDEHQKLRNDPSLIKTAVQEMFRYESPLPYFHRFASEDCTVAGMDFKAGTRFGLLYGAANRDPDRFDAPDVFDINRNPNRHIAFGGGTHFCLGNHLARLDMDVIFRTLNERFGSIELVDENPEYKRGLSVRGPKSLKISWKAE
jgi:cytochrome P450